MEIERVTVAFVQVQFLHVLAIANGVQSSNIWVIIFIFIQKIEW